MDFTHKKTGINPCGLCLRERRHQMDMKWHKIALSCPDCKVEPLILAISSSGDGEILLDLGCPKCNTPLRWVSSLTRMMANAIYADFNETTRARRRPQPNTHVVPPLAPPSNKDDDDFLHDMGIEGLE